MLEIVAVKYNEIAPVLPVKGQLPASGGSIGRSEDNDIALPDPLRLLSRRHLLVKPDGDGAYLLTNVSTSNPAVLNDVTLAPGEHSLIKHGDIISIGGYLLEVRITAAPEPAAHPQVAADLSNGQAQPLPPDLPTQNPPAQSPPAADINAILDQGGTPALMSDDPLGIATLEPTLAPGDFVQNSGQLLDGLLPQPATEPLAHELTQDPLMAGGNPLLAEGVLDPLAMFAGTETSLDNWLGASAEPSSAFNTATPARPANELHAPFSLASLTPQAPKTGQVKTEPHTPLIPEEFNLDELLGIQQTPPARPDGQTAQTRPKNDAPQTEQRVPPTLEPTVERPVVAEVTTATATQTAAPIAEPDTTASNVTHAELAALHAALLDGLKLDDLPAHRTLDADFMRTLGALLRTAIDGTLKLMAARATVKREVRANVTVISPERNNPLKFSPDADVALLYLLGRDYPGFMDAQEAVEKAFADLLSHQLGVMSGMRSALSLVLERFDPETITRNTDTHGMIDNLLSMGRKARLWDAYGRYFEHTREQAADRFQEFFGAAFVQAYEAHTQADDPQDAGTA